MMAVRTIEVRERVMAKNDEIASAVRQRLHDAGIPALNLVSSPGSGKCTPRLVQAVVTNGACHLDARQVQHALDAIDLADTDLLFIENVGNLVCPAHWDLGEDAKVVLFSVTEGEDKPLKYPSMFRESRVAVLTKIDLLPHVPFDVGRAIACARQVNPALRFFFTSALTGEGMETWFDFLREQARVRMRAGA
jgi:hydrogenase nickel incorporation protein HypB